MSMNCEYVRETYGVPAEVGRRVVCNGKPGIIAEDRGNHLGILFDSDKPGHILSAHPMWKVEYLGMGEVRRMTRSQRRYQDFVHSEYPGSFSEWLGIKERSK